MWTLYAGYRPFGTAVIMGAHDHSGYTLHMVRPSGECYVAFYQIHLLFFLRVIIIAHKEKVGKLSKLN